ncbi:MAG: hypothetical protein H3C60_02820 [Sphingomonadaceae bacterium]|nr:hypothetical protein [Sphingomonadaceae bacterium]
MPYTVKCTVKIGPSSSIPKLALFYRFTTFCQDIGQPQGAESFIKALQTVAMFRGKLFPARDHNDLIRRRSRPSRHPNRSLIPALCSSRSLAGASDWPWDFAAVPGDVANGKVIADTDVQHLLL